MTPAYEQRDDIHEEADLGGVICRSVVPTTHTYQAMQPSRFPIIGIVLTER